MQHHSHKLITSHHPCPVNSESVVTQAKVTTLRNQRHLKGRAAMQTIMRPWMRWESSPCWVPVVTQTLGWKLSWGAGRTYGNSSKRTLSTCTRSKQGLPPLTSCCFCTTLLHSRSKKSEEGNYLTVAQWQRHSLCTSCSHYCLPLPSIWATSHSGYGRLLWILNLQWWTCAEHCMELADEAANWWGQPKTHM